MRNRTGLFVAALLTVLTLVFAVSSPGHAYFGVKAGAFLPNSDDDGLDGFDTGYSVEGFYGYEFNPNFALEAGIGYYRSEGSESDTEEGATLDIDATASAVPLTLTAKGSYPVAQGFTVFAGAGVGAYFAKLEVDGDLSDPGIGRVSLSDDDTNTAFGFHVVAGGEYKFSNGMAALAEFKWFKAETDFEIFDENTDDINIGGIVLSLGVKF